MSPPPVSAGALLSPESISAAGLTSERLNLPLLQSKMKTDPSLYEPELHLLLRHFESSLDLFRHQSALNPSSDPVVAKNLGDLTMVLAHLAPFYAEELKGLPGKIAELLGSDGRDLPSSLRLHLVQALILLTNRKIVELEETLELFMNLQIIGDRTVRKLAFSHVVHSIKRMNQKHKNETKNRKLQNIVSKLLQGEEESRAKRALTILCELHRRKVWFDERTANAICYACFHTSNRIRVAALSFLLGYENVEQEDDSDESESEDESNEKPHVILSKEDVYKANKKGTTASKKKKKAKLKRVMRSMKRQQRISSENSGSNYYSPLTYLKDPQGFSEKLLSQHKDGKAKTERFEVKMMRLRVICRTVGLHRLILLPLYDDLENYAKPHQRDVTVLLAAAVQACHDMVPPDAVEPLFKSIVNSFVHDRSSPEAITVGLNVVRELCLRMPLLMNEDLLQDLVLYKKTRNKGVSIAARSLISLFREICPSLLVKKDRGRPVNPTARPKAYGETSVATDVVGIELLQEPDDVSDDNDDMASDDDVDDVAEDDDVGSDVSIDDVVSEISIDDDVSDEDDEVADEDGDDDVVSEDDEVADDVSINDDEEEVEEKSEKKGEKRKLDFDAANASLRALKKLAMGQNKLVLDQADAILSNEDFKRIKEIQAKKEANDALVQHGLRNTDKLSMKPLDPSKLQAHVKRKMTKEERMELVKAGREDRDPYRSRAAVKKKKTGGTSNAEKQRRKKAPMAVSRGKARSRNQNKGKKKKNNPAKQFRGRKAWK
ncbi:hypothetical protein LUZ60_009124 [Juncus effusus]|nr:hypothetical protein LUZ60_009124 [Juncus effusus]